VESTSKNNSRRRSWTNRESPKKVIVQNTQPWKRFRSDAQQKPLQAGSVRIAWQSGQILEHAIWSQQLRRRNPFQTKHHRIQQREKHLTDTVAIVALRQAKLLRKRIFKPNSGQESVQQVYAAIMSEARRTEFNDEFSRTARHLSQSYLLVSFGCNALEMGSGA
jgi:hypothetical protein